MGFLLFSLSLFHVSLKVQVLSRAGEFTHNFSLALIATLQEVWISLQLYMLNCLSHADTLWVYGLYPIRLLCPWDSPGNNTGVGCHAHFRGIFLTQGPNSHLLLSSGFFTTEPPEKPLSSFTLSINLCPTFLWLNLFPTSNYLYYLTTP